MSMPAAERGEGEPAADVYRAVADSTRRAILDLLIEGELAVKELQPRFAMSQPALSQHLRVLREAGLVSERRVGRLHVYRLNALPLADVRDWLAHYERFWDERFDRLGHLLDRRAHEGRPQGDIDATRGEPAS